MTAIQVWAVLGMVLATLELLLPGLVVFFVGLGAVTVAGGLFFELIESLPAQLSTWFISTLVYTFTIRLWIIRLLPSEVVKEDMNEDNQLVGLKATVSAEFDPAGIGRVEVGDSTWKAVIDPQTIVQVGGLVEIEGRDNITLHVKPIDIDSAS